MPVLCSQCGRPKGSVNNWVLMWTERDGTRLCSIGFEEDPAMAREETVWKLCGQGCAIQMFSRWMTTRPIPVHVGGIGDQ